MWALGILLLEMATLPEKQESLPFNTNDTNLHTNFPYTPSIHNLITSLLHPNPTSRPTPQTILQTPPIKTTLSKIPTTSTNTRRTEYDQKLNPRLPRLPPPSANHIYLKLQSKRHGKKLM